MTQKTINKDDYLREYGAGTTKIVSETSSSELTQEEQLFNLYQHHPIPEELILSNLGLFLSRKNLSRILTLNKLYQKIVDLQGIICEFGVFYGQNLALFESFRGMYEPYNHHRKIVGFDTFAGFPNVDQKDQKAAIVSKGAYAVPDGYENYLSQILDYHEQESPIAHLKKYELVKGDVSQTINDYLDRNPETLISLAYFDLDLYQPTKICLEKILPHLSKGAIIAFDELNYHQFPGETIAFQEVLGANNFKIQKDPNSVISWLVFE